MKMRLVIVYIMTCLLWWTNTTLAQTEKEIDIAAEIEAVRSLAVTTSEQLNQSLVRVQQAELTIQRAEEVFDEAIGAIENAIAGVDSDSELITVTKRLEAQARLDGAEAQAHPNPSIQKLASLFFQYADDYQAHVLDAATVVDEGYREIRRLKENKELAKFLIKAKQNEIALNEIDKSIAQASQLVGKTRDIADQIETTQGFVP